jgi:hypothetical protein
MKKNHINHKWGQNFIFFLLYACMWQKLNNLTIFFSKFSLSKEKVCIFASFIRNFENNSGMKNNNGRDS